MEFSPENRPTKLYVHLSAIAHNIKEIRKILSPGTEIIAVIKASGYGSGSENIVKTLIDNGIKRFAAAIPAEAIRLRDSGVDHPILVLTPPMPADFADIVKYDLTPSVSDFQTAEELNRLAKDKGRPLKIHVEVDTGMGRTGLFPKQVVELASKIEGLDFIEFEGLFTHFSSAESDFDYTNNQISIFNQTAAELDKEGMHVPIRHLCNSAGIVLFPEAHYEFVRPGLMLYGYYPDRIIKEKLELRPALELKTKIVHIKEVPAGTPISYNQTFIADKPSVIATLPIGYADGYKRELSNRGFVLINGQQAPVIGRVCMDLLMIDVTHIPGAKKGDEVTLFGPEGIIVEELAEMCNTINYEIISTISPRIPRIYID